MIFNNSLSQPSVERPAIYKKSEGFEIVWVDRKGDSGNIWLDIDNDNYLRGSN